MVKKFSVVLIVAIVLWSFFVLSIFEQQSEIMPDATKAQSLCARINNHTLVVIHVNGKPIMFPKLSMSITPFMFYAWMILSFAVPSSYAASIILRES